MVMIILCIMSYYFDWCRIRFTLQHGSLCLLIDSYAIGHVYLEYTSEYTNVHTHH